MITDILLKIFKKDSTVKRHLVKTVSWRIVGSLDTVILSWFITGKISIGAKIGGMELITKMILYFVHERAWHRIKFGLPTRASKAKIVKQENSNNLFLQQSIITRNQREERNGNKSFTIWLTGLSASGKSSIAAELDSLLFRKGKRAYVIDGDNTRLGINSDLSFSKEDRSENIRRVAEICRLFNDAGIVTIASFISPFEADRKMAEAIIGQDVFVEVFVDASLETCKQRDLKGLYKLAESGKIKEFTGVSSPYERPLSPDVHVITEVDSKKECASKIIKYLESNDSITLNI